MVVNEFLFNPVEKKKRIRHRAIFCKDCYKELKQPVIAYVRASGVPIRRNRCETCFNIHREKQDELNRLSLLAGIKRYHLRHPEKVKALRDKHNNLRKGDPKALEMQRQYTKNAVENLTDNYIKSMLRQAFGSDVFIPDWYIAFKRQVILTQRIIGPVGRMPKERKALPYDPINKSCTCCGYLKNRSEFYSIGKTKYVKSYCIHCSGLLNKLQRLKRKINEIRRKISGSSSCDWGRNQGQSSQCSQRSSRSKCYCRSWPYCLCPLQPSTISKSKDQSAVL